MRLRHSKTVILLLLCAVALPAQAKRARWVETHSWKGREARITPLFRVNGAKFRCTYKYWGREHFAIDLYNAGAEYVKEIAQVSSPIAGTTYYKGRGIYYLDVFAMDNRWEVDIHQYLTTIEEWRLLQTVKRPPPALYKLGMWFGHGGTSSFAVDVPHPHWKLVCTNRSGGRVMLSIKSKENENIVFSSMARKPGKTLTTWMHEAGAWQLEIVSHDADWKLEVFQQRKTIRLPDARPSSGETGGAVPPARREQEDAP